jgi:hypothetical protein
MTYAKTMMGGGTPAGQALAISGGGTSGITGAGSAYSDAYQLGPISAHVITGGAGSSGVKLYIGAAGDSATILNVSGQSILVYPPTGFQIDALTVTTQGFTLTNGQKALFTFATASRIIAVLSA